jgi:hypothetical protein
MEVIGNILKFIFTYFLYPCVVLGIFASIGYWIYSIGRDAVDVTRMIRRLAAAALPMIVLIFLIIAVDAEHSSNLGKFILSIKDFFRLFIGIVIGVDIIEAGRFFYKSDRETGISIYTIFLSSVLAFLLYMIMLGGLGSLRFSLFGMVLAGIVLVIFRGLPGSQDAKLSKVSIATILLLNLLVVLTPLFIAGWVFKDREQLVSTSNIQESATPKHNLQEPKAPTSPIQETAKSEISELNPKEKAYIDLLKSAVTSQNRVNYNDFMRAMKELKEMGSYKKIPIPLVIDALKRTYPNTDNDDDYYYTQDREIALEAISFFVKVKAKEACELLYQIQARGGFLYEHTKKAAKEICGY